MIRLAMRIYLQVFVQLSQTTLILSLLLLPGYVTVNIANIMCNNFDISGVFVHHDQHSCSL